MTDFSAVFMQDIFFNCKTQNKLIPWRAQKVLGLGTGSMHYGLLLYSNYPFPSASLLLLGRLSQELMALLKARVVPIKTLASALPSAQSESLFLLSKGTGKKFFARQDQITNVSRPGWLLHVCWVAAGRCGDGDTCVGPGTSSQAAIRTGCEMPHQVFDISAMFVSARTI